MRITRCTMMLAMSLLLFAVPSLCALVDDGASDRPEGAFFGFATGEGTAVLRWTISSLEGIAGFHIDRASSESGPFERVNEEILPAESPGIFEDTTIVESGTYWYLLIIEWEGGDEEPLFPYGIAVTVTVPSPVEPVSWGVLKARFLAGRLAN